MDPPCEGVTVFYHCYALTGGEGCVDEIRQVTAGSGPQDQRGGERGERRTGQHPQLQRNLRRAFPLGQRGGEELLRGSLVLPHPRAQRRRAEDQPGAHPQRIDLGGRHGSQRGHQPLVDRGERGLTGRPLADQLGDERVVVVGVDHRLLGREMPEERHVRDAGRRRNPLDRRRLVAVGQKQPQSVLLDPPPGLLLALLAQPAHAISVPVSRDPAAGRTGAVGWFRTFPSSRTSAAGSRPVHARCPSGRTSRGARAPSVVTSLVTRSGPRNRRAAAAISSPAAPAGASTAHRGPSSAYSRVRAPSGRAQSRSATRSPGQRPRRPGDHRPGTSGPPR